MEAVRAYKNHGRWLVDCPKHGKAGAMPVDYIEYKEGVIFPCCYHGIIASIPVINGKNGLLSTRADTSARATARLMARSKDEIFEVVYPNGKENIDAILSVREAHNQNWLYDEDVDFLLKENKENDLVFDLDEIVSRSGA